VFAENNLRRCLVYIQDGKNENGNTFWPTYLSEKKGENELSFSGLVSHGWESNERGDSYYLPGISIQGMDNVKQIDDILSADELVDPNDPEVPEVGKALEFENASFSHATEEVMHGISFQLNLAQLVA
jgi:hypothetical protein